MKILTHLLAKNLLMAYFLSGDIYLYKRLLKIIYNWIVRKEIFIVPEFKENEIVFCYLFFKENNNLQIFKL